MSPLTAHGGRRLNGWSSPNDYRLHRARQLWHQSGRHTCVRARPPRPRSRAVGIEKR